MKRRITAICVTLVIMLFCMVAPVSATDDGAWMELLEYNKLTTGNSWFRYTTQTDFSIALPQLMRVAKVDILLSCTNGTVPTSAAWVYGSTSNELTVAPINDSLVRLYGAVTQSFYSEAKVRLRKSGNATSTVEVLSFKVSPVNAQEFEAEADVYIMTGDGWSESSTTNNHIEVPEHGHDTQVDIYTQARISVYDWQKYDELTIWGSTTDMPISSIRVTIGTTALPIEVSYMQTIPTGQYVDIHMDMTNSGDYTYGPVTGEVTADYEQKTLFCITVDLRGVDRATDDILLCYMTGVYNAAWGATYNCQYVNGSVYIADTTSVTWWSRFTSFMTGLFSPSSGTADDFQSEAEEQGNQLDEMNEQLQNVTKPPVEDIETDIDSYVNSSDFASVANDFSLISNNGLVVQMVMLALTVGLVGFILYGKR